MASRKDVSTLLNATTKQPLEALQVIQGLDGTASANSSFHLEDPANSTSGSPPLTTSQHSSRNPSPSRSVRRPSSIKLTSDAPSSSSSQPPSPTRLQSSASSRLTLPSAAAAQRALSTAKGDPFKSTSIATLEKQLRPLKVASGAIDAPSLPRNASPSPSAPSGRDSGNSSKTKDVNAAERPSSPHETSQDRTPRDDASPADPNHKPVLAALNSSLKPLRGTSGMTRTLETVEEGDNLLSSNEVTSKAPLPATKNSQSDVPKMPGSTVRGREGSSDAGAEGAKTKPEEAGKLKDFAVKPTEPNRKKSFSALIPAKLRANDPSTKLMTVETETVASIPQTSTNGNPAERMSHARGEGGGVLRMRPSNETIRPKKDKKKVVRKPPSIIAGGASTKADIFEAKVASAVDENTSDSDETFVYESNPPEPRHRQYRHHSRTPSANSMQSMGDRRAGYRGHMHDSQRGMRVKRSMKFASASAASSSFDSDAEQQDQGTVRASRRQSGRPTVMQYQHIGLYGRGNGNLGSPFETESPFSQASRVRLANDIGSRHSSRPGSPRISTPTLPKTPSTIRGNHSSPYEFDPETADDERAPLVGSLRSQRVRSSRRPGSSQLRQIEYYDEPRRSFSGYLTGCFVMLLSIFLIILGIAGLLFATTKPMYGVAVQGIHNVIASEQELMMDLSVGATNPNVIAVTVMDMDVNVFAKSRYVSADWNAQGRRQDARQRRRTAREQPSHISNSSGNHRGVDEGTDPIDEDPQTMLLGRIFHFDSALTFDGSPLRRLSQNSSGELRLQRPGNKSEVAGSERWERVLQHPFELIVKGILKYELPLNSKIVTASIGSSVTVSPEEL